MLTHARTAALAALALTTLGLLLALAAAGSAHAEFPYPAPADAPNDYTQYRLGNETPDDLAGGKLEWMYAATPEQSPDSLVQANNANPLELRGVRGAHLVDDDPTASTAWKTSTGRPDVAIAILGSAAGEAAQHRAATSPTPG
jgi:hypothetical protein